MSERLPASRELPGGHDAPKGNAVEGQMFSEVGRDQSVFRINSPFR